VEDTKMKALNVRRIKIRIGDSWVSPILHVLLTKEDDVVVARCLDFTVSSHGKDEKDASKSLADAIKEYILTSIEDSNIDNLSDPAHNKYWRMFNELEAKQLRKKFKRSMSKAILKESPKKLKKLTVEVTYA
jgi:predicted RNase H-like HicB family nuclease